MEDIPPQLIMNWDHTGLNYIPVSNWTMAKKVLSVWKFLVYKISDR